MGMIIRNAQLIVTLFVACLLVSEANAQLNQVDPDKAGEQLKTYFFVMLVKGPNRTQDSATVVQMQRGHLENMDRMAKEGKLDIAGPFATDIDWRGILIFNMDSEEAVRKELDLDPMIRAGRLSYLIHPWMSMKGAVLR